MFVFIEKRGIHVYFFKIHLMSALQALLHINNQKTMLKAPSTPVG